ncbi:T9SS type A sorting domain-containing protein [Nibribacter ruber]|uniref:T9SS type A sorting domain-containing protein n=1 Tax=Nibribacter ruber TaxID=2698458 RepID=A0A6P1NS07_9BACT|nr:T9SS type A sorting domain-containing protein [Nibribacter ruber]QHL86616.1 T9SS type A sorting domain-containing protein [Nibribacter ruber]
MMLLLSSSLAFGQMKQWDKTYGGTENDELEIVRHTSDGGYILAGNSYSGISGDKTKDTGDGLEFWVVKVDAAGEIEWNKVYDGLARLSALEQTSDGGYILGGTSSAGKTINKSDPSRGGSDMWVIKINSKGKVQWDQTLGGSGGDALNDIIQTSDGGYLLGGSSSSMKSGDKSEDARGWSDFWIVKLSSKGKQQWDRTYGGSSYDGLNSLLQTSDGGYLLGGGSVSLVSGDKTDPPKVNCTEECAFDFWLVKVDALGMKEWDRTMGAGGGESGESILDMVATQDGGYLLGGASDAARASYDKTAPNYSNNGSRDFWVVKITAMGQIQWDRTVGGTEDDRFGGLLATSDGGFLIGGRSISGIGGDKTEPQRDEDEYNAGDYWVVKLSATGTTLWDKSFGGAGDDVLSSMDHTMDGGYIIGGSSTSPISGEKSEANVGGFDFWIVKMTGETCVVPTPAIALTRMANTYTGDVPSTLYLGYGPESIMLTASGGTSYSWSPATGLSSTNTAETVFTATEAGMYTFTVTVANGECTATESVTITVMDVRCGSKLTKVMICHKGQMICIADDAVKAHLKNHPEDRLGECGNEEMMAAKAEVNSLRVYPNPFTQATSIAMNFIKKQQYTVEIYDMKGKLVQRFAPANAQAGQQVRLEWSPKQVDRGLYVVKLITSDGVQTMQLLRQ